ncbi:MAG: squalene--hopene cyclase [Gammaproteobacteria bacterium]
MTQNNVQTITDSRVEQWLSGHLPLADVAAAANIPASDADATSRTITQSAQGLLQLQHPDGHWRFDLEADTTIPAEYMLLQHLMGTVDQAREKRLADYIISHQSDNGSWPLYEAGPGNISATVKSYFALKMAGLDPASEVMQQARDWIHLNGGAESSNVFTRILLAMFGQLPWRTVPAMLPEIIWLPRWFLFSLSKVSYWSRCVIVPLLIIYAYRPVFKPAPGKDIRELFTTDPTQLKHIDQFKTGQHWKNLFLLIDRCLKQMEPLVPAFVRNRSVKRLELWTREHMRGEGGIGAIYPAMANAVYGLKLLGYAGDDPDMMRGMQAIEDLVIDEDGRESYIQPCVSPVWDTCLSLSALSEVGMPPNHETVQPAVDWLLNKQIFVRGDWCEHAGSLDGGGWAFQYENNFYPDLDDTSMVLMALLRAGAWQHPEQMDRMALAVNWLIGMQNSDGGWGAFDIDNHYEYLNNIPFADHGALVDPSTADLTGRCIEALAMFGFKKNFPAIQRGLEFLRQDQEADGSWFGRWGVNYIYGTWATLVGLAAAGEDNHAPCIRKAVKWLQQTQNSDGGWGEDCNTYDDKALGGRGDSTPSQTAWALLGLMAVGEYQSETVERGIHYLTGNYSGNGGWEETLFTGTGFPKVFYLRYHGYSHYFPIWALGVYRRLQQGRPTRQDMLLNNGPHIDLANLPVLGDPEYLARFKRERRYNWYSQKDIKIQTRDSV